LNGVYKYHGLIQRKNLWQVRLDLHGWNFVPVPGLLEDIDPEKAYLRGMGIDAVVRKLLGLLQVEDVGPDILVGCVLGLDAHGVKPLEVRFEEGSITFFGI
jgi:hypothetical protein